MSQILRAEYFVLNNDIRCFCPMDTVKIWNKICDDISVARPTVRAKRPMQQPQPKICPMCSGRGTALADGYTCSLCEGTGKLQAVR
jgi:hypothetical protein